jgi:biopolymer transport protein ExbB
MRDIIISQFYSIGGPVLAVLLALSVVATAVAVFKLMALSRLGVGRRRIADQVVAKWEAGDAGGAQMLAASDQTALGRVLAEAIGARLRWPNDKERAREVATGKALSLLDAMNRHVRLLETCVQAAPMLGLLGTVLGMIAAFAEMSGGGGAVNPTQLAGGIWVALSTTALGLAIAIPLYFFTSWIEGRIERERAAMDSAILKIVYGSGVELAQSQAMAAPHAAQYAEPVPLRR